MLECVQGHCPSIAGQPREIVSADGMVGLLTYLVPLNRLLKNLFKMRCT